MPGPCPPKLQPNLLSSAQEISFTGLFPNQALLLQVSPVRGTGACDYGHSNLNFLAARPRRSTVQSLSFTSYINEKRCRPNHIRTEA